RNPIEKLGQLYPAQLQTRFLCFQSGQAQEVVDQKIQAIGMPLHHSINVADFRLVEIVYLEQGLKIASENGKRRAQFMGNIRDEIPANFVGLFQARNILKQGNYSTCRLTVVYNRNGGELKICSLSRCAD